MRLSLDTPSATCNIQRDGTHIDVAAASRLGSADGALVRCLWNTQAFLSLLSQRKCTGRRTQIEKPKLRRNAWRQNQCRWCYTAASPWMLSLFFGGERGYCVSLLSFVFFISLSTIGVFVFVLLFFVCCFLSDLAFFSSLVGVAAVPKYLARTYEKAKLTLAIKKCIHRCRKLPLNRRRAM